MSYVNRRSWKNRSSGFSYTKKGNGLARKIVIFFLLLFLLYQIITAMFIASYRVESISMEPTIPSDAIVLASPIIYGPEVPFTTVKLPGIRQPARGDIVICKPAYIDNQSWYNRLLDLFINFFTLQKKGFGSDDGTWAESNSVKRVVGVPGDTVKMEDYVVYIRPEGNSYFFSEKEIIQLEYETYKFTPPDLLGDDFPISGNMREVKLGPGEFFLSGDNRSMSNDSFYWGPVTMDNIIAKVILEYVPEIRMLQ